MFKVRSAVNGRLFLSAWGHMSAAHGKKRSHLSWELVQNDWSDVECGVGGGSVGGGHELSACQKHKKTPKIFQNIPSRIVRNHTIRAAPQSSHSASCFPFHFPSSFFFPSNHICFSTIEGAHTHLALKFRHTVLTKNCKQQPLHPLPWPGVWVTLEKNLLKAGRKKREFSKNRHRVYVTQSLCNQPLETTR